MGIVEGKSAMSKSTTSKTTSKLHCPSCARAKGSGSNGVGTVHYLGQEWCRRCARIGRIPSGTIWVQQPSTGRMVEGSAIDPLVAWRDCFEMKPKCRIKVQDARREITRAWTMWDGDKDANGATLMFFGWLQRLRHYFLTFRGTGDPWQRVNGWLLQYERANERGKAIL